MPTRLWEVDYSRNTFGEPAQPSGAQTSSTGTVSNTIALSSSQLIVNAVVNKSLSIAYLLNPLIKRYEYIYTDGIYYESGTGLVNVSNGIVANAVQAAKNLGRPTNVYQALPAMGTALDKAIGAQNLINGSVSPPKGLSGATVRTR